MSTVAITNPSDSAAKAGVVENVGFWSPRSLLEQFGERIEDGAIISVFDLGGITPGVWQYIAERYGDEIKLRTNNTLSDYFDTANAGETIDAFTIAAAAELETFTVYGVNDDGEGFTAVVNATEDTVEDVGVQAGLVDEGYEHAVKIVAVLRGDQTEQAVSL